MLRVQRGICRENSWRILRRYNEFAVLHKELQISGVELPLPGKKIVGKIWIKEKKSIDGIYKIIVAVH